MGGIPAAPLVIALIVLFAAERLWRWARGVHTSKKSASAVGLEELTAMFYGSKRLEQEQRDLEITLRDDDSTGAPPATSIDLNTGVARIHRRN